MKTLKLTLMMPHRTIFGQCTKVKYLMGSVMVLQGLFMEILVRAIQVTTTKETKQAKASSAILTERHCYKAFGKVMKLF